MERKEAEAALAGVQRWCVYDNLDRPTVVVSVSDILDALEKLPSREEAAEARQYFDDVEHFKARALKAEAELYRIPARERAAFVKGCKDVDTAYRTGCGPANNEEYRTVAARRYPDKGWEETHAANRYPKTAVYVRPEAPPMMRCEAADRCPQREACKVSHPHPLMSECGKPCDIPMTGIPGSVCKPVEDKPAGCKHIWQDKHSGWQSCMKCSEVRKNPAECQHEWVSHPMGTYCLRCGEPPKEVDGRLAEEDIMAGVEFPESWGHASVQSWGMILRTLARRIAEPLERRIAALE
jgi:hypothetical protein